MRQLKTLLIIAFLGCTFLLNGCGGGSGGGVRSAEAPLNPTPGVLPVITAFSINGSAGVITGNKIALTLPYGTNVSALAAKFSAPGAILSVAGLPQVSGVSTNNFTNSVVYTVTKVGSSSTGASAKASVSSGEVATYTVTVTVASITANAMTAFSLGIPNSSVTVRSGIISITNINVIVPFGTNVTSLIATFTVSGTRVTVNGVIQENGVTPNDFTNPVTYTVTAADGSTQSYIVKVTVASSSANSFIGFSLNGTPGVINEGGLSNTISVGVPYGTNLNGLVAAFITTGTSVAVNSVAQISGTTQNNFTNPVSYIVTAADGTVKTYIVTVTVASISDKAITEFSLGNITGIISNQDIIVTVPFGTNVTALIPTFTTNGSTVTVNGVEQVSTVTPNDFTNPVSYTIIAADGSTITYKVTVVISPSTAKAIMSFAFGSNVGVITDHHIAVAMPFGTDVTNLSATFITSGKSVYIQSTPQTSGSTTNDFTNPVIYTVYAADGSTTEYIVAVTVAPSSAKALTTFSIAGSTGIITNFNIAVTVPFGTNVAALIATYTTTGESVKVGGVPQSSNNLPSNNFTTPVTYTVVAADGTTQDYIVTVTVAPNTAKALTSFTLANESGVIVGTNIAVTVPYSANITALIATFTTTGISVFVGSTQQVSGSVSANNFTTPVLYVVNAADGSSTTYTVTVTKAPPYAYVANNGSNTVSIYSLNENNGQLTSLGTTSTGAGSRPYYVALDPSKHHLYVTNLGPSNSAPYSGSISVFDINNINGSLTLSSTVPLTQRPTAIVFNQAGTFAYVSNLGNNSPPYNSTISMFSVNTTTGALTALSPAAINSSTDSSNIGFAVSITINPAGNYIYVCNQAGNGPTGTINWFSMNAQGQLTSQGALAQVINTPLNVAFDPTGLFLYTEDSSISRVYGFNADPSTGAIGSATTSLSTGASTNPERVTVSASGANVYVTLRTSGFIAMYSASNGVLTSLGTISGGTTPQMLVLSPSGNYAYVTSTGSNLISMYNVDNSTGILTTLSPGPTTIAAGSSPISMVIKY